MKRCWNQTIRLSTAACIEGDVFGFPFQVDVSETLTQIGPPGASKKAREDKMKVGISAEISLDCAFMQDGAQPAQR